MNHTLEVRDGILQATTHGAATAAGLLAVNADILSHPDWVKGGTVLLDHSDLNTGPLTVDDIYVLAKGVERVRDSVGLARVAIVVRRDVEYGMVRMWEIIVSERWDAAFKCFKSHEEAVQWLKNPGVSSSG